MRSEITTVNVFLEQATGHNKYKDILICLSEFPHLDRPAERLVPRHRDHPEGRDDQLPGSSGPRVWPDLLRVD